MCMGEGGERIAPTTSDGARSGASKSTRKIPIGRRGRCRRLRHGRCRGGKRGVGSARLSADEASARELSFDIRFIFCDLFFILYDGRLLTLNSEPKRGRCDAPSSSQAV